MYHYLFLSRLGWTNLELLLSQFQERFEFGVHQDLRELVRLESVNGDRARALFNADIKTIAELAASDPVDIEQILHHASSFRR